MHAVGKRVIGKGCAGLQKPANHFKLDSPYNFETNIATKMSEIT